LFGSFLVNISVLPLKVLTELLLKIYKFFLKKTTYYWTNCDFFISLY